MLPNLLNLLKNRRSVKKYSSKEVSDDILSIILEGARWAPSAHNAQPWRFIVIRDSALKRNLARRMASRWDKDLSKNGMPRERRESQIQASVRQFENAPVLIIACLTMEDMDKYPDEQRKKAEYVMGVQSVAAAIENMVLAAHSEGLGACWFCAPLFCQDDVREVLKIPKQVDPQALIALGYPSEKPISPPRKSLEEIMHQDRWRSTM